MTRQVTPAETVRQAMDSLGRLVRNLLVDNPNFKPGTDGGQPHHFEETPRTAQFVGTTLRSMADSIVERVSQVRELAVDMAADADVPGLSREHRGRMHDHEVRVHVMDGNWRVDISVPDAFHDGDDVSAEFPDEGSALDAARAFSRTGEIPEGFGPARRDGPGL